MKDQKEHNNSNRPFLTDEEKKELRQILRNCDINDLEEFGLARIKKQNNR